VADVVVHGRSTTGEELASLLGVTHTAQSSQRSVDEADLCLLSRADRLVDREDGRRLQPPRALANQVAHRKVRLFFMHWQRWPCGHILILHMTPHHPVLRSALALACDHRVVEAFESHD